MPAEVIGAQDLEKTLRIVITSGMVNHERFVGALRDSLVPACKKVQSCPGMSHKRCRKQTLLCTKQDLRPTAEVD